MAPAWKADEVAIPLWDRPPLYPQRKVRLIPTMYDVEQIRAALIDNGRGLDPERLTFEALNKAECLSDVAVLPRDYRARMKYLGNLLAQMGMTVKDCDEQLKLELYTITTALSYLLNSSSYQDGEYHHYDKAEINRKLRRNV